MTIVNGKAICKYNEFITEDIIGNKTCIKCPKCPIGYGLTPQCGSIIKYGDHFRCEKCKDGETYSSTNDISSCKPCAICDQEIISKCTPIKNSNCGKGCKEGFYYSEVTYDCQECSWCCLGSSPVKDCQKSGVPFYKQCDANNEAFNCQPRCTDKQYVYVDKLFNKTCLDCKECSLGQGLYPPCSSVITSTNDPKCKQCSPQKTFSDVKDSSTCKKCSTCQVGK